MSFSIKRRRSLTFILLPAIVVVSLGIFALGNILSTKNSDAISGWDAGNIMSDYMMANKSSMTITEIQAFLNNKVPNCDTWGEQPSEFGGGTRRQWAEARGYSAPFTCLRDYSQNGKSAARIIYETAQSFSINPQVLLVLLQKEQSLVTDTWPLSIQYRSATGYGCPDTAACDSDYYGFTNQVRWAARMFRAILNDSPTWYTPYELGTNFIRYSPDSSCGGSNVNIQNRATQALYNYTPYQPNQAALNAGWGTVHCGAYGNRNFYLYFTSWFGSTRTDKTFVSLEDPRWMQLKNDARKVDPLTGQEVDDTLSTGRQLRFTTKSSYNVNGEKCLRTETDTKNKQRKCILWSDLRELVITLEPIAEKVVRSNASTFKRDLRRGTVIASSGITEYRQVAVTATITIGGTAYYVSKQDVANGINRGLLVSRFPDSAAYQDISPIRYELSEATRKVTPVGNVAMEATLPEGMQRIYTSRVFRNSQWYYRSDYDTSRQLDKAIPASKLAAISYEALDYPRWMQVKQSGKKATPIAGGSSTDNVTQGQQLKFASKVQIDGKWYLRTQADTTASADKAIPINNLEEIPYERFFSPRELRLKTNTTKYLPAREQAIGDTLPQGMVRKYDTKVSINGIWYYRSEYDTKNRIDSAIRASDLEEIN
jgi:hypothetical protein